jgi:hypothetical protein
VGEFRKQTRQKAVRGSMWGTSATPSNSLDGCQCRHLSLLPINLYKQTPVHETTRHDTTKYDLDKMSSGENSDLDLLARLNALKRTPIDLNNKLDPLSGTMKYTHPVGSVYQTSQNANPTMVPETARALHADLLDRFKSLSGRKSQEKPSNARSTSEIDGNFAVDDDRTIEELLADLGPREQVSLAWVTELLADVVVVGCG